MTELKATRTGFLSNDCEITEDGRVLTRWDARTWRAGGTFELGGHSYEIKANLPATRYELTHHATGEEIAVATHMGRKHWKIESEGSVYQFERVFSWRPREHLVADGRPVGSISRAHLFHRDTVATLPGLPRHIQVFALLIVLSGWELAANG
jgi:hypothetical protein